MCKDGVDDDGDGLVDGADPNCRVGDDFGGVPVFYEVGKDRLHLYADFGVDYEHYALGTLEDRCCNIPLR